MKVYELAKKLEVKSVFLMNKIRKEWGLPVKNHMEELTPKMAKTIEEKFYATSKKTVAKKKTTKKTTHEKSYCEENNCQKNHHEKSSCKKNDYKKSATKKR